MRHPNFFIVGAPKCGTSTIDTLLGKHPDIFMAPKEPHYFATDMEGQNGRSVRVTEQSDYEEKFANASSEQIVGETSPWYLRSTEAAENIYEYNPGAKILAILRDPVDMIQSLHQMNVVNTTEDCLELEEALQKEQYRKNGNHFPPNAWLKWDLLYREAASFSDQVSRYEALFPSSQVKVILFEELLANKDAVVKKICNFLNIEKEVQLSMVHRNKAHDVRNLGVRRLVRSSDVVGKMIDKIPAPVRSAMGDLISIFSGSVEYDRDPHSSAANKLRSDLAAEVRLLDDKLPCDLYEWWSFDRPSEN